MTRLARVLRRVPKHHHSSDSGTRYIRPRRVRDDQNRQIATQAAFSVCGPATAVRRRGGGRSEPQDFVVHHFAGQILYTVEDFVAKNRATAARHDGSFGNSVRF